MASRIREWDADFATDILELTPKKSRYHVIPVSGGRGRPYVNFKTLVVPGIGKNVIPAEPDDILTVNQMSRFDVEQGKVHGRGRMLKAREELANQQNKSLIRNLEALDATSKSQEKQKAVFSLDDFPALGFSGSDNPDKKAIKDLERGSQVPDKGENKTLTESKDRDGNPIGVAPLVEQDVYRKFSKKFLKHLKNPENSVLIRNISENIEYKDLQQYFERFGVVRSIEVRGSDALVRMSSSLACSWIVSCLDKATDCIGKKDVLIRVYGVNELIKMH